MRCYPRIPTDSFIDWNQTCEAILRNIRASSKPFQGAFSYYDDLKIYIHCAESIPYSVPCCVYPGQVIAVNKENGQVNVAAKDGIIVMTKICVGNDEYRAADILKSTRIRLNYCIQEEIYQLRQQVKDLKDIVESWGG